MTDVLLAPHNDDEALFASFTCLRHRPHVVVCLRSFKQGQNWARRELETAEALRLLGGCPWEQWIYPDTNPPWPTIRQGIKELAERYERCFAPFPRFAANGWSGLGDVPPDGVCQHDRIGAIAQEVFGERYVGYLTYTKSGKDEFGTPVPFDPSWIGLKLQVLSCYRSQYVRPEIAPHFLDHPLREYYARETEPKEQP